MKYGVVIFQTDYAIRPDEIAQAAEARDLLGQHDRVVLDHETDAASDLDLPGCRRGYCERHEKVHGMRIFTR